MNKFDEYFGYFTEKKKNEIINFYDEVLNFFGNRINAYLNLEYGYDTWFLTNVILPERQKILHDKIRDIFKNSDSFFPEIIKEVSNETLANFTKFKNSNEHYKSNAIIFVVNSIYTEFNFNNDVEDYFLEKLNLDDLINSFILDENKLIEQLDRYNNIIYSEDVTFLDTFPETKNELEKLFSK